MQETYKKIRKDKQIIKFCTYGFLKNLKFFEPFLIIYLLQLNLNLLLIGVLYSVREVVNFVFEVPSGILADNYGKKTVLSICFIFYIISFVLFFIGGQYWVLICAMVFFGLGEAFRSGTHKAMIYTYLEKRGWFGHKGFVYGRTRSFSLIGSSVSAIVSIVFILQFQALNLLFLLCIIPYILDFILILTYPESINTKHEASISIIGFFRSCKSQFTSIFKDKSIMKIISSASLFDAVFKSIKDYVQPILQAMLISTTIITIKTLSPDDNLKVYLAIIYGVVYLLCAIATRNVYKLNKHRSSAFMMNLYFDVFAVVLILISLFIRMNQIYIVIALYFLLYIAMDSRRPLFVDVIGDFMKKRHRATVLSIESLQRAVLVSIFAPLFGFIADTFSMSILFLLLGIFCIVINRIIRIPQASK